MIRKKGEDRRRQNLPVAVERRTQGHDRRRCPGCGGLLKREVRAVEGGSETWTFCETCSWRDCTLQAVQSDQPPTAGADAGSPRDWAADRRRVNRPVDRERRSGRHDRRVCPECHSPLQQFVRRQSRGSLTRTYCVRCGWSVESRQDDDAWAAAQRLPPVKLPPPALVRPAEALKALAEKRLAKARAAAAQGQRPAREERRRVNVPVAVEQRHGAEKRHCPECGSSLQQSVKAVPGGAITRIYCTKCEFAAESRQVDEDRLRALLGFQAAVLGSPDRPWLELPPDFLKVAGLKPGDPVFIEPIYTPGSAEAFKWVLKTPRSL